MTALFVAPSGHQRPAHRATAVRVLVVAPQPFYQDRGTPIAVRQLLDALTGFGFEVDLLTYPVGSSPAIEGVRYFRTANPLRFRSVPIGLSFRKVVLDGLLTLELVRRLREGRYDVVHAVEEAALPAILAARRYGVAVIYDMASSLPEQLAKHRVLRPAPVQALLRAVERWLVRNADQVISSAGLAHKVRALAPATPVREWSFIAEPPGVDTGEVEALRRELRLGAGTPVVLYAGSFAWYQGLGILVPAMEAVVRRRPDAVFVLVGALPGERRRLRRELGGRGVEAAVRLVDRQPRERMAVYLALADVLVSPRQSGDNLPLKIFDYLAAGRPIVATDLPTHRAVLNDDRAVLVEPEPHAFAAGVLRLLEDDARAARLATAARRYAEAHLGRATFNRMVEALYRETIQWNDPDGSEGQAEGRLALGQRHHSRTQ